MPEISETREMAASAQEVWRMLVDFQGYARWNPYVRVEGTAEGGRRVRYSFRRGAGRRPIETDAELLVSEDQTVLRFSMGGLGLVHVTEWFAIDRGGTGVRVTHGVRFSGFLSLFAWPIARRMDRRYLWQPLDLLARHLQAHGPRRRAAKPSQKGKRNAPAKRR